VGQSAPPDSADIIRRSPVSSRGFGVCEGISLTAAEVQGPHLSVPKPVVGGICAYALSLVRKGRCASSIDPHR
jgi:hypothetical protein